MWYVLPDSNKQYPLTIERVRKIRQMNMQNVVADDLGPVEVNTGKPKEETETGFVDLVGQISLKTLEKATGKKGMVTSMAPSTAGMVAPSKAGVMAVPSKGETADPREGMAVRAMEADR
jgi:hypothetical protein